ncbi:MAG: hypothetical protein IJW17_02785 [Lentisphaeria bacterium]|nr:hypothetical protein [Lentisphaeria bacterium]
MEKEKIKCKPLQVKWDVSAQKAVKQLAKRLGSPRSFSQNDGISFK